MLCRQFSLGLAAIALTSSISHGRTTHVPADQPTIQAAIDAASAADMILVAPGTYTGPGNTNLVLNDKYVYLVSEAGADNTVVDCGGFGRGLSIESSQTNGTLVEGFTFRNGSDYHGGTIRLHLASPTIRSCVFANNVAWGGGAFYCSVSSPTIEGCGFVQNAGDGGAIALSVGLPSFATACFSRIRAMWVVRSTLVVSQHRGCRHASSSGTPRHSLAPRAVFSLRRLNPSLSPT